MGGYTASVYVAPRGLWRTYGLRRLQVRELGSLVVTFGRLAVIVFELVMDVIVYLFTVLCDFARWSILDVVDSRMSVNVGHMYN